MCVSDAQADGAGDDGYVPLPTFTLQDFQRLAVAPAENHVQPAPDTLKNMNTNVYAVAQPQTFETTLGGYPVSVRAYPAQYTWNYGDGASLGPTPLTGAPLPDGAVDFAVEVRAMPDVYTGFEAPDPSAEALGSAVLPGDLVARALATAPSGMAEHPATVHLPLADGWGDTELLTLLGTVVLGGAVLITAAPEDATADVLGQERAVSL